MQLEAYAAYGVAASYREAVRTVQPYGYDPYANRTIRTLPYMPYVANPGELMADISLARETRTITRARARN
jgi:hypothetical protein